MNFFFEPWNWYIAGPLIGLFVPALLIVTNKMLGISSSFEHICMIVLPKDRQGIFKFNMQENGWKLYFSIGIAVGAFIVANFLSSVPLQFLPDQYHTTEGYIKLFCGGILVGFGTRYANGCTSGHSIFGLSILQSSSLKATISFFAGGLLYTFLASLF
ncbi:MAG: YeeE/YedE thiosulfate transporter family protein [Bacteriovoracaceae bacterium]|nr:YeeE/YedE family protein [Bacteroidota bacterium]